MRGGIHRVGYSKPQNIANRQKDERRRLFLRHGLVDIGGKYEQDEQPKNAQRDREQDQRPRFSCPRDVLVHQPPNQNITENDKHHGNHGDPGKKPTRPTVDIQNVGHIGVEVVGKNCVSRSRQRRTDEIAKRRLRDDRNLIGFDQAGREFVKKTVFFHGLLQIRKYKKIRLSVLNSAVFSIFFHCHFPFFQWGSEYPAQRYFHWRKKRDSRRIYPRPTECSSCRNRDNSYPACR